MVIPSVQDLIKNIDNEVKQTFGPNRHIVASIKQLIYSNARFEESTKKTEMIMIALTIAQVVLAFVTLIK